MVVIAVDNALETTDGFLQRHVHTRRSGKNLCDEERLAEEAFDFASSCHGLLVFLGKLVHAENCDDVLQFLVTLQRALDLAGDVVVLLTDDQWIELARSRVERIHGRVDAELGNLA